METDRRKFVKIASLFLGGIFIIIALYLFSSYSYIEITAKGADDKINYSLVNQDSQKKTEFEGGQQVKKLVKKGPYELFVNKSPDSSFAITKASGFLRTKTVELTLSQEKSREFIGNSPRGCMYVQNEVLYSYECGVGFNEVVRHVPADQNTPTYVQQLEGDSHNRIEGIVNTKLGTVVLLKQLGLEDFPPPDKPHTVFLVQNGSTLTQQTSLGQLDPRKNYSIVPYREGFLVYDSGYQEFKYYSSLTSEPVNIGVTTPKDSKQKPYLFATDGQAIALAYSNKADFQINTRNEAIGKVNSSVFIFEGEEGRLVKLDQQYEKMAICGKNKLCLFNPVSDDKNFLYVVDISGDKAKNLYSISNVKDILQNGKDLLVVRDQQLFNFNADKQIGSIDYSFGEYKYCGIQNDGQAYVLCLTNSKNKSVALKIDPASNSTSAIDKKIAELQDDSSIKEISVYKNFIYILPDYGGLVFDNNLGEFTYPPEIKKRVIEQIKQLLNASGIAESGFAIAISGS